MFGSCTKAGAILEAFRKVSGTVWVDPVNCPNSYLLLKGRALVAEPYHPKPAHLPLLTPSITHHLAETGYDLWFGLNKRQWKTEASMGEGQAKSPERGPSSTPNSWP